MAKPTFVYIVFTAKVISGGRITIPEKVRLKYGIKDGDLIDVKIIREGKV